MLLHNVTSCLVTLSSLVAQAEDASDRAPIKAVLDDAYVYIIRRDPCLSQ
jgi:hypothetical protein